MKPTALKPPFNPAPTGPCVCGSGQRFVDCCARPAADRPPPHGVHIVPAFVDEPTCRRWRAWLEAQPRKPLAIHGRSDQTPGALTSQMSQGRVTDKVKAGDLRPEINERVEAAYRELITARYARSFAWIENPQVLRYEAGGQYGRHADSDHYLPEENAWVKSMDRDVSLLIYLNGDFSGGALEFFRYNYRYRPQAGDLLFFPSDHRYIHQAMPVTSGVRYAVVSWAAFTDEPRVGMGPPAGSMLLD